MKSTAHRILSAITGIGLTTFTVFAASTSGVAADMTTTAFGLLTVYGLFEIAFASYRPTHFEIRHAAPHNADVVTAELAPVRVAAIVEYPAAAVHSHAA